MSDQRDCIRTRSLPRSGASGSGPARSSHVSPDRAKPPAPSDSRGRPPSSPPAGAGEPPGDPAAVREAFLWRLENPVAGDLIRRLGEVLFDVVDETGQFGPVAEEAGLVRPALRAAALDLFHVARDLAEVGLLGRASTLDEEEAALAERAEVWAAGATALAAAIREAVGE